MQNYLVDTQRNNTLTALLAQDTSLHVVNVDSKDLQGKHLNYYPYFGNSTFINGDFLDPEIQEEIVHELGKPHIIIGNMLSFLLSIVVASNPFSRE